MDLSLSREAISLSAFQEIPRWTHKGPSAASCCELKHSGPHTPQAYFLKANFNIFRPSST